jgi:hypothetical protein
MNIVLDDISSSINKIINSHTRIITLPSSLHNKIKWSSKHMPNSKELKNGNNSNWISKEKNITNEPDNGPDLGWDGDAAYFLHKQKYIAQSVHDPTNEQLKAPIWHLQKEMTLPWETASMLSKKP